MYCCTEHTLEEYVIMKKQPNVIILLTDDQRAGTIHALGNDVIQTPHMDELVRRGTSFTRAHIPGGTLGAVCMPSRAMLNSGRTLFHLSGEGQDIPAEHITLGECLRGAGYHTHGVGKWHNGPDSYARSFCSGADIFFGGMWDHWNVPVCDYNPNGQYEHRIHFTPNFSASGASMLVRADRINAGVHSTDLFSGDAVRFIQSYNEEKPFFLYLSFLAPHDPRTMPEEFKHMYKAEDIPLPDNFAAMPVVNCGWSARGRDETIEAYPRDPMKVRQHIADYYAMISHIDYRIGEVMDAVREKGLLEDTIVVLMGDNGLAIGQHGLMGKQNIYEHSVGVPLVMAGPGIPQNERREQLCYLLDVYPTLCELCGVEIPASVEGKSLLPVLQNADARVREELYLAFQARIRGVMDERFKLLEYRTENLKLTQLFDLQNDPWEKNNCFDLAGYEEITARLRARLLALRDEWDDAKSKHGSVYWQAWENYEKAVVVNPSRPTGSDPAKQLALSK